MRPSPDLGRFLDAHVRVYDDVLRELRAGRKESHWMWFVFPQLKALGRSGTAKFYGIEGRVEALAYWQHPVLGRRLADCAGIVLASPAPTAHAIFGSPDDLKLRSCMTLFDAVAPEEPAFRAVLRRFYGGEPDRATLDLLR